MSSKFITTNKAPEEDKILRLDVYIRAAPKTEIEVMKAIRKEFGIKHAISMEIFENHAEFEINGATEHFNMAITAIVREPDLKKFEERIKNFKNVERITTFIGR